MLCCENGDSACPHALGRGAEYVLRGTFCFYLKQHLTVHPSLLHTGYVVDSGGPSPVKQTSLFKVNCSLLLILLCLTYESKH